MIYVIVTKKAFFTDEDKIYLRFNNRKEFFDSVNRNGWLLLSYTERN